MRDLDNLDNREADETEISDEQFRQTAKRIHVHEGTLEIDDGSVVSRSRGGGAYIQAWVWVYNSDVKAEA